MYKEMIPADNVSRKDSIHPAGETFNPAIHATSQAPEMAPLHTELAEWKNRYLRLAADFDNFRKRIARENDRRAAEQKNAFVRDLLPVVDNLERALSEAQGTAESLIQLREGIGLTLRQLTTVLNRHGFEARDDLGKPFDPQFHEAVGICADPAHAHHAIVEVWQCAWLRGAELIRPAKVIVNDLKSNRPTAPHENTD